MDYRCRECGAVFNIFTDTVWSKTHEAASKDASSSSRVSRLGVPFFLRFGGERPAPLRASAKICLDWCRSSRPRGASA